MKKIALFLLAVVVLFTACEGPTANVNITVKPSALTLKVGESSRIAVSVDPAGDYEFEWKSLNANVATVSNGVVTGVATGSSTITASITVDGTNYTDTCTGTVVNPTA